MRGIRDYASHWAGALLPPTVWLVQFEAMFALVDRTCATGNLLPLHLCAAASLLLTLGAGSLALYHWNHLGKGWPTESDGGIHASWRLLAALGILTSPVFSLLIIAQWIATFMIPPCQR
jgi:hypothetical protein